MAEIPKVPKEYALFPVEDLAGVDYNPNMMDVGMGGQPFGVAQGPPLQPPMQPPMSGFGPPMTGQPVGPMGAGPSLLPQQGGMPMPQPINQPPQGAPMPQPQMMGGQGMPMGGQPPQMPPPPGQAAQSLGPIGRLKQFLNQAQAQDPQQWMLMMAALTQAAHSPQLPIGMAQQAIQGRREAGLKREQIEATRDYRDERQRDREEARFLNRLTRFNSQMMRYGARPDQVMPPGKFSIENPEDLDYAEGQLQLFVAEQVKEERYRKIAKDVASGARDSLEGTEFAGDKTYEGPIANLVTQRELAKEKSKRSVELINKRIKELDAKVDEEEGKLTAKQRETLRTIRIRLTEISREASGLRTARLRDPFLDADERLRDIKNLEREMEQWLAVYDAVIRGGDADEVAGGMPSGPLSFVGPRGAATRGAEEAESEDAAAFRKELLDAIRGE